MISRAEDHYIRSFDSIQVRGKRVTPGDTNSGPKNFHFQAIVINPRGEGGAGVSILTSYEEKPPVKELPIFSEFIENSTKFIKNSGLTKWTQNLR